MTILAKRELAKVQREKSILSKNMMHATTGILGQYAVCISITTTV